MQDSDNSMQIQTQSSKNKPKNETFYVKKRGLFRKADQVVKGCSCDVFIVVYHKESNKIYTYQNDERFSLERVSGLILKDVRERGFLNKNKKFEETDFTTVKQNIDSIQKQIQKQKSTNYTEDKSMKKSGSTLFSPNLTSECMEGSISLSEQQLIQELHVKNQRQRNQDQSFAESQSQELNQSGITDKPPMSYDRERPPQQLRIHNQLRNQNGSDENEKKIPRLKHASANIEMKYEQHQVQMQNMFDLQNQIYRQQNPQQQQQQVAFTANDKDDQEYIYKKVNKTPAKATAGIINTLPSQKPTQSINQSSHKRGDMMRDRDCQATTAAAQSYRAGAHQMSHRQAPTEPQLPFSNEEDSFTQTRGPCNHPWPGCCNKYDDNYTEISNTVTMKLDQAMPKAQRNWQDQINKSDSSIQQLTRSQARDVSEQKMRSNPNQIAENGLLIKQRERSITFQSNNQNQFKASSFGKFSNENNGDNFNPMKASISSGHILKQHSGSGGQSIPSLPNDGVRSKISGQSQVNSKRSKESIVIGDGGFQSKHSSGVSGMSKSSYTNQFLAGAMPPPRQNKQGGAFAGEETRSRRYLQNDQQDNVHHVQRFLSPSSHINYWDERTLLRSPPRLLHESSTTGMRSYLKQNKKMSREFSETDVKKRQSFQNQREISRIHVQGSVKQEKENSSNSGNKLSFTQNIEEMQTDEMNNNLMEYQQIQPHQKGKQQQQVCIQASIHFLHANRHGSGAQTNYPKQQQQTNNGSTQQLIFNNYPSQMPMPNSGYYIDSKFQNNMEMMGNQHKSADKLQINYNYNFNLVGGDHIQQQTYPSTMNQFVQGPQHHQDLTPLQNHHDFGGADMEQPNQSPFAYAITKNSTQQTRHQGHHEQYAGGQAMGKTLSPKYQNRGERAFNNATCSTRLKPNSLGIHAGEQVETNLSASSGGSDGRMENMGVISSNKRRSGPVQQQRFIPQNNHSHHDFHQSPNSGSSDAAMHETLQHNNNNSYNNYPGKSQ